MSNKTISINPDLFSFGSLKTKKKREKKTKQTPLISPNVLKNKLLKRIKEHKQLETANLENNKKKLLPKTDETNNSENYNELLNYSDEFSESLNYLQTLSKQKKINDEKQKHELQKQKRKEEIERKTLKNYHLSNNVSSQQQQINLDLPEELIMIQPSEITIDTSNISEAPLIIKPPSYVVNKDPIPYGILKGGFKPTFRNWTKTQRNYVDTNLNSSLIIPGSEINSEKTVREKRLNYLREKIKQKQIEELIQKNEKDEKNENNNLTNNLNSSSTIVTTTPILNTFSENTVLPSPSIELLPNEKLIAIKQTIKKTIKRKYTLGRSSKTKTVAVLVKDRGTRKNILCAQKELKQKPINDVKNYLRDHNLIKAGSNAPNEILRKIFETSMLAGEITNSNADTLLFNFSKDEKEL